MERYSYHSWAEGDDDEAEILVDQCEFDRARVDLREADLGLLFGCAGTEICSVYSDSLFAICCRPGALIAVDRWFNIRNRRNRKLLLVSRLALRRLRSGRKHDRESPHLYIYQLQWRSELMFEATQAVDRWYESCIDYFWSPCSQDFATSVVTPD